MSWNDFLSGYLAGSAGVFVGHPLDTLKVKMQMLSNQSLMSCIRGTYRHERLKGFFRGMTFPLMSSGAVNSIFFGVYGHACRWLGEGDYGKASKDRRPQFVVIYAAGCLAAVSQLGLVVPIDVVKVKLQSRSQSAIGSASYRGSIHCLHQLWSSGGLRGCYRGFWIQACRDVPSYGLYVLTYEWILYTLSADGSREMLNAGIAGGLAGVVSWTAIIPLDVVKSRLQAEDVALPKYEGMADCFRKSYREEGSRVFFKGLGLATARALPTNAAILIVYSWALACFGSFQSS